MDEKSVDTSAEVSEANQLVKQLNSGFEMVELMLFLQTLILESKKQQVSFFFGYREGSNGARRRPGHQSVRNTRVFDGKKHRLRRGVQVPFEAQALCADRAEARANG